MGKFDSASLRCASPSEKEEEEEEEEEVGVEVQRLQRHQRS